MKEIELDDDLPQELVDYTFEELERQLQRHNKTEASHLHLISSARLITINNDDKLCGIVQNSVEQAIYEWIMEHQNTISKDQVESYHPSKSVTVRTV